MSAGPQYIYFNYFKRAQKNNQRHSFNLSPFWDASHTFSTGELIILEMRSKWFLSGRSKITMPLSSVPQWLYSRGKMELFVSFNTSIHQLSVSSPLGLLSILHCLNVFPFVSFVSFFFVEVQIVSKAYIIFITSFTSL